MPAQYVDASTGQTWELADFIQSVAQLKRVVRIPGITLQRLAVNGYTEKAPRTIAEVASRGIVFEDGAHLDFPKAAQFDCAGDIVTWGPLKFRVSLTPVAVAAHNEGTEHGNDYL